MTHELSIAPEVFEPVNLGLQRALLHSDENVESGDTLRLNEYEPETGRFSGRWLLVRITHVGLNSMLSIALVSSGVASPYFLNVRGAKYAA